MQVVDEAGQRASKVSPYSVESVCDDHDINNNLKYIQMNNFKNNCQIKNHTESLDLPSSTTLTDALEDKLNGYGHRCSSQEQEQYETYITRLVRRVKTKFSRPDSETKDICNTVRKALSKLSQLENSCNES